MGYRSDGKLYMKKNVYNLLTDELKEELKNWDEEVNLEENEYAVYAFSDWKWYENYKDVKIWINFFDQLQENEDISKEDWDFIVVGEDNAIIDSRTQTHLYITSEIGVF